MCDGATSSQELLRLVVIVVLNRLNHKLNTNSEKSSSLLGLLGGLRSHLPLAEHVAGREGGVD